MLRGGLRPGEGRDGGGAPSGIAFLYLPHTVASRYMLMLRLLRSVTAVGACLLGACASSPTAADFSGLHHPALGAVDSVALGSMPFAVAISPAGVVYVTQATGGFVARAAPPKQSLPAHIALGAPPPQGRMSPDRGAAHLSNQDAGTITAGNVA